MAGIIGVISIIGSAAAFISIVRNRVLTPGKKILWAVIVAILPIVGFIAYFVIGNKKATA